MTSPRSSTFVFLNVVMPVFLFFAVAEARPVPITETGYTLEIPDPYSVSRPQNAPDILLQCTSPGKEATIQVVRAARGVAESNIVADYENKMRQALPNLRAVDSGTREMAGGRPSLFKRYNASDGNTHVRVMALFYTGSKHAFVIHSIDEKGDAVLLRQILTSLSGSREPALTHERPAHMPRHPAYQPLAVDDSGFEFLFPVNFKKFQQSEGQSQWSDPHAKDPKVVMVLQTMTRSAGNTMKSVVENLISQVRNSPSATLLYSRPVTVNGISAHKCEFTLAQKAKKTYFYYLILDIPGPNVATISFVGPASVVNEMKRHYEKVQESVRTLKTPSRDRLR